MADLIDRQDLIKALHTWDMQDLYLPVHFQQLIDAAPSIVPPKGRIGKWIWIDEGEGRRCSCCDLYVDEDYYLHGVNKGRKPKFDFCPNCGAYMRGNRYGI